MDFEISRNHGCVELLRMCPIITPSMKEADQLRLAIRVLQDLSRMLRARHVGAETFPHINSLTGLLARALGIPALPEPLPHLLFHRERLRGIERELRFEGERVRFQRYREMRPRPQKSAHKQVRISVQPKNLKLRCMHQPVKQSALNDEIVKNDDIDKVSAAMCVIAGNLSMPATRASIYKEEEPRVDHATLPSSIKNRW